ncbi:MAG TPA: hypothetical protein VFH71_02810 [Rhodanobacteraceae bacterium]|nr:hypothetical protein [Rhodanobacteraceae bacterium]
MNRFDAGQEDGPSNSPTYAVVFDEDAHLLKVRMQISPELIQEFDCKNWLRLEKALALSFAEAFVSANLGNAPITRAANYQNIELGFMRWLGGKAASGSITFSDLTADFFSQFDTWLDRIDQHGKRIIKMSTALHWRASIAGVIGQLLIGPSGSKLPSTCRLRRNPFAGRTRETSPEEPFDLETFTKFLRAVKQKVVESYQLLDRSQELIKSGEQLLLEDKGRGTKARLLATLRQRFGPVMPPLNKIRKAAPDLYDNIQDWGGGAIYRYMHPSQYDLLPLAYFVAVCTAFNESAVLGLQDKNVRLETVMGVDRIIFSSFKARAAKNVVCSFVATEEPLNPYRIVKLVRAWTHLLRPAAPAAIAGDFWLFVPRFNSRERHVRSMKNPQIGLNYDLNNAQVAFSKEHGLPRIGFRRLRATVAALAQDLFGGDIRAVMEFLQHSASDTTLAHYTTGVAAARYSEIVANVQVLRDRWVASNGKIDPRLIAQSGDPGAATPGFHCLDPYDSPVPGQRRGRLCDASGTCPVCPHAQVDISSQVAYAQLLQVRLATIAAKEHVLPQRWKVALEPVLEALSGFWLELFPDSVRKQAESIRVSLPIIVE